VYELQILNSSDNNKQHSCINYTDGSVGAFLSGVFASPAIHLDVYVVDNVKEVFHDCDLFVPGAMQQLGV